MSLSPLVWYQLLDCSTRMPYKNTTVDSILHSSIAIPVISQFRKAVHHENAAILTEIAPSQLIIYKNKADFDNQHANNGKQEPLKSSCPLDGLGETAQEPLIVVVPTLSGSSQTTLETGLTEYEPHPLRKLRWFQLNDILDRIEKQKVSDDSTPNSSITWRQVQPIFSLEKCSLPQRDIDADTLNLIMKYLSLTSPCFGYTPLTHSSLPNHLIAPIVFAVCNQFQGDIEIVVKEDIVGKYVDDHGRFDFMLKRKNKVVCIVVAKNNDINQAMAQVLVGCEVAAGVWKLDVVYGIATNYLVWHFIRNDNDRVEVEHVDLSHDALKGPDPNSVKVVAGKIYSMLSDDQA